MNVFKMNKSIPAPTIVPTIAVVIRGTPVTFPTAVKRVGTKYMAIVTPMMAETNPPTYSRMSNAI